MPKLSNDDIAILSAYLSDHEKYKKSYFWSPPCTASQRRKMEFVRYNTIEFAGDIYELRQSISCSCKNVYYESNIEVNGEKKDIRAIKKLLNLQLA